MTAKDHRLGLNIRLPTLQYNLSIALLNRMVQCGVTMGYSFPPDASKLKQLATGIQLPSVLANYVESIGYVQLASGATVVPFVDNFATLFGDGQPNVNPGEFLEELDVPWEGDEEWPLHINTIVDYNDATTRASRTGMNFRVVDNSNLAGKVEMLVSYRILGADMLIPVAPQQMSEAEAQLGTCYRFRNYAEIDLWLGANRELLFDTFTAIPCTPRVIFSDICVAAFRGATISTN